MKHATYRALRCMRQTYSTNNILFSIYVQPEKARIETDSYLYKAPYFTEINKIITLK